MSTHALEIVECVRDANVYAAAHGRGPAAEGYRGVTCRCHVADPDWPGQHPGSVTSCSGCECAVWWLAPWRRAESRERVRQSGGAR